MEGVGWIGAIIIGAIAGWIAEKFMDAHHGLLTNIILGILGAIVLNWILMLIFGSLRQRNIVLTLGGLVVVGIITLLVRIGLDIAIAVLDPRVKVEGEGSA